MKEVELAMLVIEIGVVVGFSFGFVYTMVKAIALAIDKEPSWTNWAWGAALCLILTLMSTSFLMAVLISSL